MDETTVLLLAAEIRRAEWLAITGNEPVEGPLGAKHVHMARALAERGLMKMRAALVRECKVSAGLADELNDAQIRIRRLEVELVALGRTS